ncbi:STAS domain-containing protein [Streptomyces sp. NPDC090077]|uniref:STAS domain-containing protein n=1 Tax=Streptomyces sp. NPDC090077 TaxID=3365938 RepID=UPI003806FDAA
MITTDVQYRGTTVLVSASGELGEESGGALRQALEHVTAGERVLMVDLHGVPLMTEPGLLHLLDLHRRAEDRGLRVLVVGWQPQPRELMARTAGLPGPASATADRYATPGFRRLLAERAQGTRAFTESGSGRVPSGG